MAEWCFHLQSVPSGVWLDRDVPLEGAEVVTSRNGPVAIRGKLSLGYALAKQVREWGVLLVAEQVGRDPISAIVDRVSPEGDSLAVEAGGFSAYPNGLPWAGSDYVGIKVDPLDVVRLIWAEVQSHPDGDLGVVVDSLKSPIRFGTAEKDVDTKAAEDDKVSFSTGPLRLAWWETEDLGKVLADLASDTPFEFAERSSWNEDKSVLSHRLQLGYPSIGSRKNNLVFEVGVNVSAEPRMADGDYASEVLVVGSGEGRKKITSGHMKTSATGRLRRVRLVTDSSIKSRAAAQTAARPLLHRLSGIDTIESLEVLDSPSAPFGTFGVGDTIHVTGDAGWAVLNDWVRIEETTVNCTTGSMSLKVSTP